MFQHEFVFLSCGDFDGNHLMRETRAKNLKRPNYLTRWINFKKVFPVHLFDQSKQAPDFTLAKTIYKAKDAVKKMDQML